MDIRGFFQAKKKAKVTGGSAPEIKDWMNSPLPSERASSRSSGVSTGKKAKMDKLAARAAKKKQDSLSPNQKKTPKKRVREEEDARGLAGPTAAAGDGGGGKRQSGGGPTGTPTGGGSFNNRESHRLQRRCLDCRADISSAPKFYKRCFTCFRRTGSLRASSSADIPHRYSTKVAAAAPASTEAGRANRYMLSATSLLRGGPAVLRRTHGALESEPWQLRQALEKSKFEAQFEERMQLKEALEISLVEPQLERMQHQELFGESALLPLRGPDALELELGVLSKAEKAKLNSSAVSEAEKRITCALELCKKVHGPDHNKTANVRQKLELLQQEMEAE